MSHDKNAMGRLKVDPHSSKQILEDKGMGLSKINI